MKSSFQTILVIVFIVVFGAAVLIFSGLISFGTKKAATTTPTGTVLVWGVVPQNLMNQYIDNFNIAGNGYTISYAEHNPNNLLQDLTVALANGAPPDLILFSSENFSQFKDKLYIIPYTAYPERTYRDANIDGAQIFLNKDGIIGMPLVVDPLVVYYNKDVIAQANFVIPPKTWSNLQQSVQVLTKRDSRNNITQSAVALGTALNVNHARDILSTLFMQTGNAIVTYNAQNDANEAALGAIPIGGATPPAARALEYYTSFSNPTNTNYSWNNSLPKSIDQFLAGKSAFYIGRASELFTIQAQNPNLNFDVAEIFQTDPNARPVTFGSFLGIGMIKKAPNPVAAYAALTFLSGSESVDALSKALSLPPARRDLLLVQQSNPYISVFFRAALSAFAWPDPNALKTEQIFRAMITDVISGKSNTTTALFDANRDLQSVIQ